MNFAQVYDIIRAARARQRTDGNPAPVDSFGAEAIARDFGDKSDPKKTRFVVLLALLFSSQTKDPVTYKAIQVLHGESLLSADDILASADSDAERCAKLNTLIRGTDNPQNFCFGD